MFVFSQSLAGRHRGPWGKATSGILYNIKYKKTSIPVFRQPYCLVGDNKTFPVNSGGTPLFERVKTDA